MQIFSQAFEHNFNLPSFVFVRDSLSPSEAAVPAADSTLAVLRALQQHIEQRIVAIARERNSLIPINKLPEELIVDILHLFAMPNSSYRSCKRHASVVLGNPSMFGHSRLAD